MDSLQPLPELECKRCGHKWIPRVPNPRRCPKCLRYDWNDEEEKAGPARGNQGAGS